ncbi:hypothetical protein KUTeg_010677 [Tegillarca granosa]|uniref:TIR domain-containing protein n=1 Tax=Tegillarca granosa TaxID=220873 RepID=A0ABQ9F609_TEGGR|nr:hypothetical protein KUTeg_010677 [Tegillarca granosa]
MEQSHFVMYLVTLITSLGIQSIHFANAKENEPNTVMFGSTDGIEPCGNSTQWPSCPFTNGHCLCCEMFKMAICPGKETKLTSIPNFPWYVEKLNFENNHLQAITSSTFKSLRKLKIKYLSLSSNEITTVTKDAFSQLKTLKTLDLSNNVKINITQCLVAIGTTAIEKLYLNNVNLKIVRENDFQFLSESSITVLSLGQNDLHKFNGLTFSKIPRLQELNVSANFISTFNLTGLTGLKKLNLSHNNFNLKKQAANFCINKTSRSKLPNINVLNLSNNNIATITPKTFVCLESLTHLYLDGNPIDRLDDFIFKPMKNLKKLSLRNLNRLYAISSKAFSNAAFVDLAFSDINKKVNVFKTKELFHGCGRLKALDLSSNVLPKNSSVLKQLLSPLKNLEKLSLNSVNFNSIPTYVFSKFPKLYKLSLRNNRIISWSGRAVFENMTSLKSLYLDNNKIAVVTESLFTEQLLKSLRNISFSFNPLRCTCENLWFRDFVRDQKLHKRKRIKFLHLNTYRCSNAKKGDKKIKHFINYNPTKESCKEKDVIIASVTSVSAILVIFSLTSCLIYKTRWHIRYRLYRLKTYKRGYKKLPEGINCANKAYVVYADEDRIWVHKELLPKLEKEHKIELCIRMRDFVVGGIMVDDMIEHFNQCKRIILVLSNNFAKCEWCKFQLALVHDRLLSEGKSIMVVVMIEEIAVKHMSKYLFWLISVNTHFDWSNETSAKRLFWEQLVTAIRLPREDNGNEIDLILNDISWTPFPAIQSLRLCDSCVIL